MKYSTPKIIAVQNAAEAIQGMQKPQGTVDILDPHNPFPSVSAYQSDE